jgi:hypothetical protein
MKIYTAYVTYPHNDESMNHLASAPTIEEAVSAALADSAVNCTRVVTVADETDMAHTPIVKGPYTVRRGVAG